MNGVQMMVVLIVAMALIASVLKHGRRRRRPEDVDVTDSDNVDAQRLRDEVRTLKDRIAVLERIATDRTSSLDHEIERLRDK